MTKKPKQSKKSTKSSKRTKVVAQPEDENDTATQSALASAPQATPATPEAEAAVEAITAPAAPATELETAHKTTRNETAKANIKEGLKQHAIAGRPTKAQLILVFGKAGYMLTWPKRTERFGITPETFQAALAKGVSAVPLTAAAKSTVEKTKGTA